MQLSPRFHAPPSLQQLAQVCVYIVITPDHMLRIAQKLSYHCVHSVKRFSHAVLVPGGLQLLSLAG